MADCEKYASSEKYSNNPLALRAWQDGYEEGLAQANITARVTLWAIVVIFAILSLAITAGCSDRYRYPCQDPANHSSKECKSPVCEADETCANYLVEITDETKPR